MAEERADPLTLSARVRWSDVRFLLVLALPAWAVISVQRSPVSSAVGALCLLFAVAALDEFAPGARHSPRALPLDAPRSLYFRLILWLYVPLQLALIGTGLFAAATVSSLTISLALCMGFAVGFVCGAVGITLAHELGHSKSTLDRFCAWVLMGSVGYGHFMVEHYRGHHPRAATLDDPASARRGESIYAFLPRTFIGSAMSGFALERKQLQQFRRAWWRSPLAWASIGALMIWFVPVVLTPARAALISAFVLSYWFTAILLLETVNYIEHYGLSRTTNETGRREPFGLMHAWNADHVFSNSLIINLQRHSDHHMHAWKPYETLAPLPGPQLPTGYAGSILLAFIPPLWFRVMHARLDALRPTAHISA